MLIYNWKNTSLDIVDSEAVSFLSEGYRVNRYLVGASDSALKARLDGLVAILVTLDFGGVPSFRVEKGKDAIVFVEILEELRLRKMSVDDQVGASLDRFTRVPPFKNAAKIKQTLSNTDGHKCLFKFTDQKNVDAILSGDVRFKTASSYKDDGFNISIKDDELKIDYVLSNLRISVNDGPTIPVIDNKITMSAADDYYVSCFSVSCEPKLFVLFEYNACVVIKNADRFIDSVIAAYKSEYPAFEVNRGLVEYVDPFRKLKSDYPIEFQKICNFSYENEFRFVTFASGDYKYHDPIQTISIDKTGVEYEVINI